jgi:hypothetical protein
MPKLRFTEERIIRILREAEVPGEQVRRGIATRSRLRVSEACRVGEPAHYCRGFAQWLATHPNGLYGIWGCAPR